MMALTTRLILTLVLLMVCLLLHAGQCTAQTNEEIFMKRYIEGINSTGIPYDKVLVPVQKRKARVGMRFPCPDLPEGLLKKPAKSVHSLAPYHIKVIGAVGDSVTAGFGAKATNILEALIEYRGVSWSIGGDDDLSKWITLPNIIKEFNPSVKGFSVLTGKPNKNYNRAVTGDESIDMTSQVRELIDMIKADTSINVEEDWKLITMWIGANDLCMVCLDEEGRSPKNYIKNIKKALNMLETELPKTFVNLVQIVDVTILRELKGGFLCNAIQAYACSCGTNETYVQDTSKAALEYQAELEKMMEKRCYDSDDFTVVLQPFMKHLQLPTLDNGEPDKSYFGLDCFHFSTKGHGVMARSLWNNMMNPVGTKRDHVDWDAEPEFKCPTPAFPYFYTYKNSPPPPAPFDANMSFIVVMSIIIAAMLCMIMRMCM